MFYNGNILLEIIGVYVLMEMEQLDVVIRKSFVHVRILQLAKVKHQQFQLLNHQQENQQLINGQQMNQMLKRMKLNMIMNMLQKMKKEQLNHHKAQTSLELLLPFSRFFSSYVQLLQSIFTSITAIF